MCWNGGKSSAPWDKIGLCRSIEIIFVGVGQPYPFGARKISPYKNLGELVRRRGPPEGRSIAFAVVGQVTRTAETPRCDGIDFPFTFKVGVKHNLTAVGRPGRVAIVSTVEGQAARVAAVRRHDVDFVVAITVRMERDLAAVGRPGGTPIVIEVHTCQGALWEWVPHPLP